MAGACDGGHQAEAERPGPPVRVTGVNVGQDRPMPADGVIQLSFDRYLLPATVLRQSVVLVDATNQPVTGDLAPIVTYDPIARTVTLSSPKPADREWLTEGQPYKVLLTIPEDERADGQGLRAIDRAPLAPDQPREIAFFVGPKTGLGRGEPKVDFCADVLPIFVAKCSEVRCHGGAAGTPAASLVLDSPRGVAVTALSRIAHGSNVGPRAGIATSGASVFGVDMPIVAPGSPAESWLLYKVDLERPLPLSSPAASGAGAQTITCQPPAGAPLPPPAADYHPLPGAGAGQHIRDAEREVLGGYINGANMPYPRRGASGPLTFQERERLRLWIAQGAEVDACGGCAATLSAAPP